jgi:hypothetical protein
MFKQIRNWMGFILVLEALSFAFIFQPLHNTALALFFGVIALVLSIRRPSLMLSVLAVEFIIGSKGSLFKAFGDASNDGGVSIRIILFFAFVFGWLIWALLNRRWKDWGRILKGRTRYIVLALVLVYAFLVGYVHGNRSYLIADANAWGLWLLLFPVLDLVRTEQEKIRRYLVPAVVAALFWLPIKTLLLFYFFTHTFPAAWTETLYLWVRRSGVGEITRAGGGAYRVFFQSHIYALFVIFWMLIRRTWGTKLARWEWALLILSFAETIVSLSRSFGIGLFVGGLVLFGWTLWRSRLQAWILLSRGILATFLSMLLVVLIFFFPVPPRGSSSLLNLLQSRVDVSDDAASSRWKLLPILWQGIERHPILGSGFGATITYQTKDPRIVEKTGGTFTTYAFEWGWLEHWLKFGLVGIPLVLWLLIALGKRGLRGMPGTPEAQFIIVSLVVLASVHAFTPYLNHPLGFAWLIALEGYLATKAISPGLSPIYNNHIFKGDDKKVLQVRLVSCVLFLLLKHVSAWR